VRNRRRPKQQRKEIKFMKNQNIMFTRIIPQMSKARLVRWVLALGIAALIMQASVPRAEAFDLSSLNGNYADSSESLVPTTPQRPLLPITAHAPYNTVALWTFDGAGGLTGRSVVNFGGGDIANTDFLQNVTGTYTVNGNGTGSLTFTTVVGSQHRRHFVISAGGNELKYIGTDLTTGIQSSGTMVKQ
jgi:hypothetical protein